MMETGAETTVTAQQQVLAALSNPACYPHAVGQVRVVETHISWVLLTGNFAYKIKKAVNLGFLDFSTLALRQKFCEDELRLNRRLAPGVYLEVVVIRGTPQAPRIGGDGPVLEYAVKMREFPQEALANALLRRGEFGTRELDLLADTIASFHASAAPASTGTGFGTPELVLREALQNFEQIEQFDTLPADAGVLSTLRGWTVDAHERLRDAMASRVTAGHIKECHGDLHLGNIAVLDGRPMPFDCIEFSPELRWIDVMSELAFLTMDLTDHGHPQLAARLLNRYLEGTGDYDGLRLLDFYQVYRALVRAKVHGLRERQRGAATGTTAGAGFSHYLALARRLTMPRRPCLVITHGLSGCGKTTVSQSLVECLGAVRVRSDVERKRMHDLAPLASSGSAPGAGIYTADATAATYARLAARAEDIVRSGYPAIVDATFLRQAERARFRELASQLRVPFVIASLDVPEPVLRARIAERQTRATDASEAGVGVLERQLLVREMIAPHETAAVVKLDGLHHDPHAWCKAISEKIS